MVVVALSTAPFVAQIVVQVPGWARRSTEALHTFARNMPSDTRVELTAMRFMPYPKTQGMRFGEMRTLPKSRLRWTNIEYVPSASATVQKAGQSAGAEAGSGTGTVEKSKRRSTWQFFVRPGKRFTEGTRGPGVWEKMLEQIERNSAHPTLKGAMRSSGGRLPMPTPDRVLPRPQRVVKAVASAPSVAAAATKRR